MRTESWIASGLRRIFTFIRPTALVLGIVIVTTAGLAGLLAGCGAGEPESTNGATTPEMKTVIVDFFTIHNKADKEGLAGFYAENAVLDDFVDDPAGTHTEGREAIVETETYWVDQGFTFEISGEPIMLGDYVVQEVRILGNGTPIGEGVHVFDFDGDRRIVHQWVSGVIRLE